MTGGINKKSLISAHVAGMSFVDIGGLWGTKGEMITTAHAAGAKSVKMADIQPLTHSLWNDLNEHCAQRGLSTYEKALVDICAPDAPEKLGAHDFVHCSGLMYHVPDLFAFVANLISVTNRYLVIGSVVMPENINNAKGSLNFAPDSARLTPILTDANRAIVREHFESRGIKADGLTQNEGVFFRNGRTMTGPWWWLFSGAFMSNLIRMHGLRILAEGPTGKSAYALLAEKV